MVEWLIIICMYQSHRKLTQQPPCGPAWTVKILLSNFCQAVSVTIAKHPHLLEPYQSSLIWRYTSWKIWWTVFVMGCFQTLTVAAKAASTSGLHWFWHPGILAVRNGERMRKWRGNGERFTLFISSLSLLSINVEYGTFVANVTKNLTYALWENNS